MAARSIVWLDGKLVDMDKVKIHPLSHSLQYGSGVFEGIRAYQTQKGVAIFRLDDHVKRLLKSAKSCYLKIDYTQKEICSAIIRVVRANKLSSCYIRPFCYIGDHNIGLRSYGKQTSLLIAAMPLGAYFGEGKQHGIKCMVSSLNRINSAILPVQAKVSGNYVNSSLANAEALMSGYDEAILLSTEGHVAEGPGENIFLVENNKLITPGDDSDVLLGVTRDSVIKIAEACGIEVIERDVHKEELYTCDELFFTGTAAELTPITKVDGVKVGKGKPGPITKMLAQKYDDVVNGSDNFFSDWLTYIK